MTTDTLFIPADLDLQLDPRARAYVKREIVSVSFARSDGGIQSREGLNRYSTGDALITGSTGDHWSVTRDRFDAKYLPLNGIAHGEDGQYQNRPLPILAIQQTQAFDVERSAGGDVIHGAAGDWLMQYAPGDHGIVENAKFQRVYRLATEG
ncbi:MAG: PGDYG domain-containing protein [Steroidobacteraceae bacterium]